MDDEIGFTGIFKSLREGFQDRVVVSSRESRHVKRGSNLRPSSVDATFSFQESAVMVVGSESCECGDLGSVGISQFRDFGQELSGSDFPDPRDTGEDFAFSHPVIIGFEELGDGGFDDVDLFVEEIDCLLNSLSRDLALNERLSVDLNRADLNELSSPGDKVLQFLLFFRRLGGWFGFDDLCEVGQIGGVNGVCFRAVAESLSEVTGLLGIDDGDGHGGVNEITDKRSFVSSGGFHNDQLNFGQFLNFGQELAEPFLVVVERPSLGQRSDVDIKLTLCDINADPEWDGCAGCGVDGVDPVLQMRTRAGVIRVTVQAAVRAMTRGAAAILLCDGVFGTKARSIYRAPGSLRLFADAQRRRLPGLHYTPFTSF